MIYPDTDPYPEYIGTEREKEKMLSAVIIQGKISIAEFVIGNCILAKIFSIIEGVFSLTVLFPNQIKLLLESSILYTVPELGNLTIRAKTYFRLK